MSAVRQPNPSDPVLRVDDLSIEDRTRGGNVRAVRDVCKVPLVASGGAGEPDHFLQAFLAADVDAALAASVFHSGAVRVPELKAHLQANGIPVRLVDGAPPAAPIQRDAHRVA